MKFLLTALSFLAAMGADWRYASAQTNRAYGICPQQIGSYRYDWPRNLLTPGIPWPAWADLLKRHWPNDEIARRDFFDEQRVEGATTVYQAGDHPLPQQYFRDYESYISPAGSGSPQHWQAYEEAAKLYRSGYWPDSIRLFDSVMADRNSPYRAAAAYTAARAEVKIGEFGDAIKRIDHLLSDPDLREFHLAAHRLLGTMAYRTGAEPVLAARLAEISHLMTAPPVLVCQDAVLKTIVEGARADLRWHLDAAFPKHRWAIRKAGPTTRLALDRLAESDAVLDLARVLAAPTRFRRAYDWHEKPPNSDILGPSQMIWANREAHREASLGASKLTQHARQRWVETKNPLWGYALAQRTTEPADLALIRSMITSLDNLPDTPWVRDARPALYWHYLHHAIRLSLMTGQMDEAIDQLAKLGTRYLDKPKSHTVNNQVIRYTRASLNGGVRYFLEKFDLDRARRWASAAGTLIKRPLDPTLEIWLTNDIGGLKKIWKRRGVIRPLLAAIDLLPAHKIVALADGPDMTAAQRRALLSAGWLRHYMLGRWDRVMALLPRLRAVYPELATDIDNIGNAWFETTRRRFVARMLLRAPGIVPRTRWARSNPHPQGSRYVGFRVMDIFRTDNANPNDGNWWCALDVDQLKFDLVRAFFTETLELPPQHYYDYWSKERASPDRRERALRLADKIIAWHPLLKDFDPQELEALSKTDNGPRTLTGHAVRWAEESNWLSRLLGRDRLLPETLHLAVRSTRYGCRRDGGHGSYSRAAFRHLHKIFPRSVWTDRTPYWFDMPG